MTNGSHLEKIAQLLLSFGKTVGKERLFPTLLPEAQRLIETDSYAFLIGVCLDRGTQAEIIWTIPYDMKNDLGHLDPQRIHRMSLDELGDLIQRLPRKPRYVNDASKTLSDITRIVVEECSGDAPNMWKGKRAAEVNSTFQSVHGVGPGIANMGVLLIEQRSDIRFSDLDRTNMDIKPDVHTTRVLHRLGASDTKGAIAATREMNPLFPGGLDAALWEIGRSWCHASSPDCPECPMVSDCPKRNV